MIALVCLSVGSLDICRSRGRSRTLYDPAPMTITAERHLVLSVDLDSMDRDGLPRNCHISWHFLGSAILFAYFNHKDTITIRSGVLGQLFRRASINNHSRL